MRTAALRRAHTMLCVCATTALAVACSSDFPNEPDRAVTLEAIAWPTELHVTDSATIEIHVRFRDSPQEITGLRLRWESSNDDVLRVAPAQPAGTRREDTLVAQRRAVVTGRSGGFDTVRVVVEAGGGFEPAESTLVIRVTQKWVEVSAGGAHTCGRTVDSVAYCWGEGVKGKLGNGRPLGSTIPVRVLQLGDFKFVLVSAGEESSCGIIREHLAYCWGSGADGRLGNGDPSEQSQFLPSLVLGATFSTLDVGTVVCGLGENLFAYCWGSNSDNQLGHFGGELPALDTCLSSNPCRRTPPRVSRSDTTPTSYRQVSVGGHHVCGVSQAPDSLLAFCWGTGPYGALGNAAMKASATPVPVAGGLRFLVIAAGGDHTCGIATSRATYCWGANGNGQLGHGATGDATTPGLITPGAFDSLTAGGQHTCGLTKAGDASCWGQLGNDSTTVQRFPVPVSGGHRFTSLSAGAFHTCGVTSDGSLYCWGRGADGRLGAGPGDVADHPTPSRVVEP